MSSIAKRRNCVTHESLFSSNLQLVFVKCHRKVRSSLRRTLEKKSAVKHRIKKIDGIWGTMLLESTPRPIGSLLICLIRSVL